ncbi:MAG: hypothetical protein DI527_01010 [Chelatococcus sp.]|nr:MAG: hypothetical protein DI527_01010 [Chelatococcus sp.]
MRPLPPELVTAPTALPVSLAEAKAHLRVDHDEGDARIEAAIAAAVGYLDGYGGILGRALMRQEWREYHGFWPASGAVELRLAPALSVSSVAVTAADGSETVVDPSAYRLVGAAAAPRLILALDAALPAPACAPDAIAITYRAGYSADNDAAAQAEAVPAALRSAILLMVGDLWRFTDGVALGAVSAVPMSTTVDRLLAPYRRFAL